MQQSSISSIQIRDYNSIKSLSDICFGKNYLTLNMLNKTVLNNCFYSKIIVNNVFTGFCLAQCHNADDKSLNFDISEIAGQKIAFIKNLAIHPDFQRQGYGTQLLKHIIHRIEMQNNAGSIYFPAWKESTCGGFCKLLISNGFKEVKQYKNYWFNHSLQNNYNCAKCGNNTCSCTMVLYKKVFGK